MAILPGVPPVSLSVNARAMSASVTTWATCGRIADSSMSSVSRSSLRW